MPQRLRPLSTGSTRHHRGDISTAAYYSTISYAAIGYTDHCIDPDWRMVAAIEGINGLLLMGWSTAFFVSVVTQFQRRR